MLGSSRSGCYTWLVFKGATASVKSSLGVLGHLVLGKMAFPLQQFLRVDRKPGGLLHNARLPAETNSTGLGAELNFSLPHTSIL